MAQASVTLYALSTCIHCRHTREYLDENKIDYDCTYVDKLFGHDQEKALSKVREVNPRMSFPTMVIGPAHTVVIGFNPQAIQEALAQ